VGELPTVHNFFLMINKQEGSYIQKLLIGHGILKRENFISLIKTMLLIMQVFVVIDHNQVLRWKN